MGMFDDDADAMREAMKAIEPVADQLASMSLRMIDRVFQMGVGEIGDRISLNLARCMKRTMDDLLNQGFTRDEALALMSEFKSQASKAMPSMQGKK